MNYAKLSSALICTLLFVAACGSDKSGNPGGVEGAFSSQATWESNCLDSDRFGLTMHSRFEIEGEAFRRINQYHSDGSCSDIAVETIEEGSLIRIPSSDGSPSGAIDLNYQRIEITPMGEPGILALNTVTYCGSNTWTVRQSRDVTNVTGGNCWEQTPRTVRDIYYVNGSDLYFGVGSEKQKSGSVSRPTAPDESRPWKIR